MQIQTVLPFILVLGPKKKFMGLICLLFQLLVSWQSSISRLLFSFFNLYWKGEQLASLDVQKPHFHCHHILTHTLLYSLTMKSNSGAQRSAETLAYLDDYIDSEFPPSTPTFPSNLQWQKSCSWSHATSKTLELMQSFLLLQFEYNSCRITSTWIAETIHSHAGFRRQSTK